jgi:hypothetical protein
MKLIQLGLIALCCTLTGCLSFTKADSTGVGGQQTSLQILQLRSGGSDDVPMADDLKKTITSVCRPDGATVLVDPAITPILVAFGKFLFDQAMDKRVAELEALKKAAEKTYSATISMGRADLLNKHCLLIQREKKQDEKAKAVTPGMTALLKLRPMEGKAFTMEVAYLRVHNAVAVASTETPEVTFSFAASTKAITSSKLTEVVQLSAIGQGAVGAPAAIKLPQATAYICERNCSRSDLIAYPNTSPVSLSVAVTETGNVGFDIDASIAKAKAIKEAIGPAIAEGLKESMKED